MLSEQLTASATPLRPFSRGLVVTRGVLKSHREPDAIRIESKRPSMRRLPERVSR